ncbi:MAG: hypothetical protein V1690_00470 [Candidatus Moraniibacteriota bacterium]
MERSADYFNLAVGDLVLLKTKLNPQLRTKLNPQGVMAFSPEFLSFDSHVNPKAKWDDFDREESMRVFRPTNNGFTLKNEGEEWIASVERVNVDWEEDHRTRDRRIHVYVYVRVLGRKERTKIEYRDWEKLYVKETVSGSVVLSRTEIRNPVVEEKLFRSGDHIVKGKAISSPDGELLLVKVFGTETREDYLARILAQIEKSQLGAALRRFSTPEEVAAREIARLSELPEPDRVQRF